jgi:hypothetical protein
LQKCGEAVDFLVSDLIADHDIPSANDGSNTIDNIVLSCCWYYSVQEAIFSELRSKIQKPIDNGLIISIILMTALSSTITPAMTMFWLSPKYQLNRKVSYQDGYNSQPR